MIASIRDYALFMLDPDGRVASWNTGAERIKGYRAEEIIGHPLSRFFTAEDVAAGAPQRELEIAAREGRFENETWRVRKDGTRFWASVALSAIRDSSGNLVGFVEITRDLTERRQAEEERVRLAQAQEAVRLRDEFLSIASHELKTPLTALMLQLQAIAGRVPDGQEQFARRVERAVRLGDRLAGLIEDLLDVSRIATGRLRLQPEPFDLGEAVCEVIERFRDAAAGAGSELSYEVAGPMSGCWDRLRVEQVVTNLVSNSIKYAAGKPISVSATCDGEFAVIEVRDHGPGIPEGEMTRVFERFERAASSRHYGGLGLGLYVAREITEAHGGTIGVRNAPGGGVLMTVRLPLLPSPVATGVRE